MTETAVYLRLPFRVRSCLDRFRGPRTVLTFDGSRSYKTTHGQCVLHLSPSCAEPVTDQVRIPQRRSPHRVSTRMSSCWLLSLILIATVDTYRTKATLGPIRAKVAPAHRPNLQPAFVAPSPNPNTKYDRLRRWHNHTLSLRRTTPRWIDAASR